MARPGGAGGRIFRTLKAVSLHLAIAAVLTVGAWWLLDRTLADLNARGIKSGFAFLGQPAGFDIGVQLIRFEPSDSYARAFLVGLLNTLLLSAVAATGATILGFAAGILRLSRSVLMARLMAVAIDLIRSCPLLLQIFFWYFTVLGTLPASRRSLSVAGIAFLNNRGLFMPSPIAGELFWMTPLALALGLAALLLVPRWRGAAASMPVAAARCMLILLAPALLVFLATGTPLSIDLPHLQGFNFVGGINVVPEFLALSLAISIYAAAFIAEIVRAGLQSVAAGQKEAARALGLSPGLTLRFVTMPIALRAILPPLANQYLTITKYSSLAAAIGFPDLMQVFGKTALNHTGQAIEVLSLTATVYLVISLVTAGVMNVLNRRMAFAGRAA